MTFVEAAPAIDEVPAATESCETPGLSLAG